MIYTCSSDFPKSPPLPRLGPHTEPLYIGSFGIGKPVTLLPANNKLNNQQTIS